eukprot:CAMPEP_0170174882 /NCGR_PEP_ID=MMETSP0040_2-20121228/8068_1 /TAXON_ID=641309 /ORGANISM="Lotharella oceanica, Strain CCMP622" /LENGTH=96 /DNA_ID=CAMNT_0010416695 /DNA_START=39 /DNA_END=326 /DNA_ORIENTATION=+
MEGKGTSLEGIEYILKELNGETYKGAKKNGRPHGQGTKELEGGIVYKGTFEDGFFHGNGTMEFPDGGKFVGIWSKGKLCQGKYFFKDKLEYSSKEW